MVDETEVVQKQCGQIIFWPTDNFALNCGFCNHDFFTFEALRAHIDKHFSELPSNIKTEDSIICNTGRADVLNDNLQNENGSQSTVAANSVIPSVLKAKRTDGSEQSEGNPRTHQPTRACKIQPTDINRKKTFSNHKVQEKAHQIVALKFNDKKRAKRVTVVETAAKTTERPKRTKVIQQCSYCPKIFTTKNKRIDHENFHTGKRPHHCLTCSKSFAITASLSRHVRLHKDANWLKCLSCERKFRDSGSLDIHTRERHLPDTDPRRYFPCEHCDVKLKTSGSLSYHKQIHQEKLTCDYCQKQFINKDQLLVHVRNHFGIRPFQCTFCPKAFAHRTGKSVHEKICSNSGVRSKPRDHNYKCNFCSRKFLNQSHLNDHETTHTGKRPHQCSLCDRTFATYCSLVTHVKVHADDKQYKCPDCEKKFLWKRDLEHHTRANHLPDTDPRRYFPCKLCDVKLKSYTTYMIHSRSHRATEDIFSCDHCQKEFKTKAKMRHHIDLHSPSIPTCKQCHQKFIYRQSKAYHQRRCTQSPIKEVRNVGFECKYCLKTFLDRSAYVDHKSTHGKR